MRIISAAPFFLVVAMLTACEKGAPTNKVDADVRAEVDQLKRDIALLKLEGALARIETSGLGQDDATFDVQGTQSYTKLKAPTGAVLVSLDRIEPYLNGFNVFIKIGNPSTAILHGVSGEINWGRSDSSDMQTKKFELLDSFPPGTWRSVKLTIGPANSQDLSKIVFSPKFNQISLGRS